MKIKDDKKDAVYYLNLGSEYIRLGDYENATTLFAHAYKETNKSENCFIQLAYKTADAFFCNKEYVKCIAYCNDIIKNFADFKRIYFLKGFSHMQLREYPEALNSFRNYKNASANSKYSDIKYEDINDIDKLINVLENIK
ncbi:tetratricopeptide repeat protein [Romboutsia sp.]|uniref:tetratricopeptide repeat protein n=1 Tax=Romboutsia sp. TaxID=1965302 RepID=UPI003F381676